MTVRISENLWQVVFGGTMTETIAETKVETQVRYKLIIKQELLDLALKDINEDGYELFEVTRYDPFKSKRGGVNIKHADYCDSVRSAGGTCDCGAS